MGFRRGRYPRRIIARKSTQIGRVLCVEALQRCRTGQCASSVSCFRRPASQYTSEIRTLLSRRRAHPLCHGLTSQPAQVPGKRRRMTLMSVSVCCHQLILINSCREFPLESCVRSLGRVTRAHTVANERELRTPPGCGILTPLPPKPETPDSS